MAKTRKTPAPPLPTSPIVRMAVACRRHELSVQQLATMVILHEAGGALDFGDVVRRLQTNKPAVTRHADRCEKFGLLRRTGDSDDRRKVILNLTPAGKKLITTFVPAALLANPETVLA